MWLCFVRGVVALLKSEEIFVGREEEIKRFFEFLKDERSWLLLWLASRASTRKFNTYL